MKLILFSFSEPFLEAVPQVMVMLCIAFLSGFSNGVGRVGGCSPQNCGIVSLLPWVDPWFFGTFLLSVFSASFGMTRFLKVGPMNLVPRNSYGLSFFIALFLVAIAIVSKGAALALLITKARSYTTAIIFWLATCVLPSFFYVSCISHIVALVLLYMSSLVGREGQELPILLTKKTTKSGGRESNITNFETT